MTRASQLTHIRQLCCIGVPGQALMPTLLRALRGIVSAESAGFFWVDAKGDMTNLYAERMLPPGLMKLYFQRFYDGAEHPFRQAFLSRAASGDSVSSSSASSELIRTAYYNEILRHLDAHHVLYAVIRDQGNALGQLSLYRPKSAPAFTAADRTGIKDISRYVAHAVNRPASLSADEPDIDSSAEGLIEADRNGVITRGVASSLNLLSMATQPAFSPKHMPLVIGDDLPRSIVPLVERLHAVLAGIDEPAPRQHFETQWGRFLVSVYALDDHLAGPDARVGIHVRRRLPLVLRLAESMGELGLSPQQREVAMLLAQGKTNQEISTALNITGNTASYHIKQLFARLDAHDRADAVAKLIHPPR